MTRPSAFVRYVDRARLARPALWRTLCGLPLILASVALVALALTAASVAWLVLNHPLGLQALRPPTFRFVMRDFFASHAGVTMVFLWWGGLWLGVWLAVRLLQRRRFGGVLGAEGRLSWPDFARAAAATLLVGAFSLASAFAFNPTLERSGVPFETWLVWAVPLSLAILVQSSGEELLFRGYLLQSLAARFRSPIVWAVLPTLVFAALHWDPRAATPVALVVSGMTALIALAAVLLVRATGNLGAAMGLHFANNLQPLLIVSNQTLLGETALFSANPLESTDWEPLAVLVMALEALVSNGLILALLLHPRSPLRVGRRTGAAEPAAEEGAG